jgi:hypothetical protein
MRTKTLYLVLDHEDYGGLSILGIYSTQEKANKCFDEVVAKGQYKQTKYGWRWGANELFIEEFNLDSDEYH